jgi:hypothetical protein
MLLVCYWSGHLAQTKVFLNHPDDVPENLSNHPTFLAHCPDMDHTGDTRHQFDPADAAAVAKAEARFKKLTGEGFTAAMRLDDGKSKVLKSFDPTAEERLFIPRLQGG